MVPESTNASSSTTIPTDQLQPGTGFNTATAAERGDCIERAQMNAVMGASGQETVYDLQEITSLRQLRRATAFSGAASFGMGVFSASATHSFMSSGTFNDYSNFIYVKVNVLNPVQVLTAAKLTKEAKDRQKKGAGPFIDMCGDEFVHKIQTGGSFEAIVQFNSKDEAQQESNRTQIRAAVKSFVASGSAEVAMSKSFESLSNQTDLRVHIIRRGDDTDLPDVGAIKEYARQFPGKVKSSAKPVVVYAMTKSYTTVGDVSLPATSFDNVTKQRQALQLYAEQLDDARQGLGNIQFIDSNPSQFENLDRGKLRLALTQSRATVRTIEAAAQNCVMSVESCNPISPTFVDFSAKRVGAVVAEPVKVLPPAEFPKSVVLDPTKQERTLVATVPIGQIRTFELRGSWRPGGGNWTCASPAGTSSGHDNVGATVIQYRDIHTKQPLGNWFRYTGKTETPQGVEVWIGMNDFQDLYGDNLQCDPPMTAYIW
jgi:hypothetical protein